MKTRFALVAVVLTAFTGSAFAQDAAKSKEDCLKQAFDLAKSASTKKLAETQAGKVEELITKMEAECDAGKFAEAAAMTKDINAAIEGQ